MFKNIILVFLLIQTVLSVDNNFKIIKNEMPEQMKDSVLGITLSAFIKLLNYNEMSRKITNEMTLLFGSHWICLIGPLGLVSHFEAEPNSTIWFTHENTQIIIFKPMDRSQSESISISSARKSNPKIKLIKNEMNVSMKENSILVSLDAINSYDDFTTIAKNISETFQQLYGYKWNCFVSLTKIDHKIDYISNTLISLRIDTINIVLFQTYNPSVIVCNLLFYICLLIHYFKKTLDGLQASNRKGSKGKRKNRVRKHS
jgi:hypothetical protein